MSRHDSALVASRSQLGGKIPTRAAFSHFQRTSAHPVIPAQAVYLWMHTGEKINSRCASHVSVRIGDPAWFIAPFHTQAAPAALPLPDKPSIIVLPFVNLSGDPSQEYFSDGMTEEITAALSRISSLFVIARTSAFTYKGNPTKVQDISREMGVRHVLEGSARKVDEQVRIIAQLIDATTGEHVWSERYDRPLKDIFALQDEIVQQIVTTLYLQLTLQEQGFLVRKHTHNLEAYDTFLRRAEYFWRLTKEDNVQARLLRRPSPHNNLYRVRESPQATRNQRHR